MPLVSRLLMDGDIRDQHTVWVRDPIDGGRVLRDASRDQMFEWCEANCTGRYWIGMGFGRFELADDALLFSMRWK
jgi:hypothetical protein